MSETNAIANDVYDYLFENDAHTKTNFCEEFSASYIDNDSNTIYLEGRGNTGLFTITIERVL